MEVTEAEKEIDNVGKMGIRIEEHSLRSHVWIGWDSDCLLACWGN